MHLHQRDPITHLGQSVPGAFPYNAQDNLQKFLNGEPVILGVAQVMIGLISISLWILLKILFFFNVHTSVFTENLEFSYNFFPLGPVMFITSGTLSIIAAKKLTRNMIQGSLVMNTVSAVLAVLSMVLIAFSEGIVTVVLILFLFELIISLSLSAFGCSTVCCDDRPVVVCVPSTDDAFPTLTTRR